MTSTPLPLDWRNIGLLALVHTAAVGGLATYLPLHGMTTSALIIGFVLTALTIFSISAGYHRLFSHRTYEAHPLFRLFLLVIGAGAFQNTALAWASDHRRHHAKTDTDLDPYDATRGFWYSHIGWVLRKPDPTLPPVSIADLQRDPLLMWQQRYYAVIGITAGLVFPTVLGWLFGDPIGGFVMGAAVRLMVSYHTTFSINSIAHMLGKQPYSDRNSSRDSFLVALISCGEGYHNFHHTFPGDYRNGVRGHQFDPTKWTLRALETVGMTRNLRRTPPSAVVRARLRRDEQRLQAHKLSPETLRRLQQIREAVDHAVQRWHALLVQVEKLKREAGAHTRQMMRAVRAELRVVRKELSAAYASWKRALRDLESSLPGRAVTVGAS
jgi:stearoyl-CoA desaturase (delta-9 desaturase)